MPPQKELDADAVGERLGIGERDWLRRLEEAGPVPGGIDLPAGPELRVTLTRLGVSDADQEAVVAAAPDPRRTPELWWLLERCAHRAVRRVGRWEEPSGPWPELDTSSGPEGRCFWIYVYLAVLPHVRRWHRRRGIPDAVAWATLADLGRHVARYRRRRGMTGLDSMEWLGLHFSGGIYALGRLQFNLYRLSWRGRPRFWYRAGEPRSADPGFRPGDPALGMHIPESGPLNPDACDSSLEWARTFFPRHFPEHRFRVVTCTSWLLDDQLAEYLPGTSNIVRFQRRFELVPGAVETDEDTFWFVFHRPPAAIDDLRPGTTLERAIVTHVRSGNHWRIRTGWLALA